MAESTVTYASHLPLRSNTPSLTTEERDCESSPNTTMEKTKRKKQGNPFKRGNTWTYIVYINDPKTGKRKQVWKGGFKTKREAAKALTQARAQADKGDYIVPSKMTFAQYYDHFMECKDVAFRASTMKSYRTALKVAASIHDKRIDKITVSDLKRLDKEMDEKGYKPSSKATYHRCYRSIFNFAVKHDDLSKSPYLKFTGEKLPKRDLTMPKIETLKELISKAKEESLLMYGVVLLGMTMGLRRGEILGLKFSDFDMEAKTVHVQRQRGDISCADEPLKTESSNRVLALPQTVIDYVEAQRASHNASGEDYVVTDEDGKVWRPDSVSRSFRRFMAGIEMEGFRLHDLRHAYVTLCLEQDVPLKIISDTLGHSKIETTANIYCDTTHKRHTTADAMNTLLTD